MLAVCSACELNIDLSLNLVSMLWLRLCIFSDCRSVLVDEAFDVGFPLLVNAVNFFQTLQPSKEMFYPSAKPNLCRL